MVLSGLYLGLAGVLAWAEIAAATLFSALSIAFSPLGEHLLVDPVTPGQRP